MYPRCDPSDIPICADQIVNNEHNVYNQIVINSALIFFFKYNLNFEGKEDKLLARIIILLVTYLSVVRVTQISDGRLAVLPGIMCIFKKQK